MLCTIDHPEPLKCWIAPFSDTAYTSEPEEPHSPWIVFPCGKGFSQIHGSGTYGVGGFEEGGDCVPDEHPIVTWATAAANRQMTMDRFIESIL